MKWSDITYRQFNEIRKADSIEDETEKMVAIMQAVYGEDVINLNINEFNKKALELSFLKEEVPNNLNVKTVKVNGRKYYFDGLLGKISTAQYIDFLNYLKNEDDVKSFSVFFIPEGHKYNDGYDMMLVFEDILDMPVPVVVSASFFFTRQFAIFIRIFQRYSMKQLKKLKMPKEVKKNLMKVVENSNSLVLYLMSSNFAK